MKIITTFYVYIQSSRIKQQDSETYRIGNAIKGIIRGELGQLSVSYIYN